MPRQSPSGTRGLVKKHGRTCANRRSKTPSRCDCAWVGRHKKKQIVLAKWSKAAVPPREIGKAREVFARFQKAVDGKYFDPKGETAPLGADQSFLTLVNEWDTSHVQTAGLDGVPLYGTGLKSVLNVIKTVEAGGSCLGRMALEYMVANPSRIQDWLNARMKARRWKPKTWTYYYGVLYSICEWATLRKTDGVPRMLRNPMKDFSKLKVRKYDTVGRIYEDLEDRLFAACATLNAPLHMPNGRAQLTQALADEIRQQVAGGALQKDVAATFKVSPATVCSIMKGDTWRLDKYTPCTKGDEMERRLIGAFDSGLRMGEIGGVQLSMVDWRHPFTTTDGTKGYVITLPPWLCKGGKTTGESEKVYAGSPRFVAMLDARREHLIASYERQRLRFKNKQMHVGDAYIFGDDAGRKTGFRRQYRKLYDAAGLVYGVDYGRDMGLTWHTTRHEYCSRIGEQTNGNVTTITDAGRFRDLKTAKIYTHTRNEQVMAASVVVNRRKA